MYTQQNKPNIVQMFDVYVDREYYKVTPGFFGDYKILVRTDRIEDYVELLISSKRMPDRIMWNGQEMELKTKKKNEI